MGSSLISWGAVVREDRLLVFMLTLLLTVALLTLLFESVVMLASSDMMDLAFPGDLQAIPE
jgi:hypothetical protein